MAAPIVYCETNWIIAFAFPHHPLHRSAARLRSQAAAGDCRLRLPLAAVLEARGTLSDVAKQFAQSVTELTSSLVAGAENGVVDFLPVAQALQSEAVDNYAQRNVLSIPDELANDPMITILDDVTAHIRVLRELRSVVDLRGKDVVDLHLLSAVIHDRRQDLHEPALLMTNNKREFDPRRRRIPADVYTTARLCWRDDFDLQTGLGVWRARYHG